MRPIKTNITYGKQSISKEDINQIVKVLKSNFITQGPLQTQFEKKLAAYAGSKYAVVVNNGTAALHLACLALGVKKKDKVISTTNTFCSTTNSVIYCGGVPVLCDIEESSFNIDPDKIEKALKSNKNIKGIIPVHFAGLPANMEKIRKLADKYNLWIIEDACHAFGGEWFDSNGKTNKIGSCSYSDISVVSFHPVKQMTTGEGGALFTNSDELYEKINLFKNHGIIKNKNLMDEYHGEWYYEMQHLGYNYRITDIQCALGISQLERLNSWVEKRDKLVKRYNNHFKDIVQITPQIHDNPKGNHSYHLYVIKAVNRKGLYKFLHKNNVKVQVHYVPVHLHPYYQNKYGYQKGDFPIAEKYYSKALSLPLYPTLKLKEQDYVIKLLKEFYGKN